MGTEAKLWSLGTLKSARADAKGAVEVDPKNPVTFTIPAFQRSLVWPERKQRELIASILKGFPFGALLLVERDRKKAVTLPSGQTVMASNYGIIDGLQRTNAIVEHLRQSLVFANADVLRGQEFDALRAAIEKHLGVTVAPDKLTDALVGWLHATKQPDARLGFEFDTMLERVADALGVAFNDAFRKALKPHGNALLVQIEQAVDISRLQIPVLIYTGPAEHLPDIFEQINTAGTMLSKYEIYAAAWVNELVTVKTPAIRSAIARRYKVLEDEGFSVDVEINGSDYSLFDYLHGLSQQLGETYPSLFSRRDAERNKLSGAFPIATLMFGKPLDKMAGLNELFPRKATRLQVDDFEKALFQACGLVNQMLAPFLAFKFTSDGESLAHGELQMASMVAAVVAHLFDHKKNFASRGTARQRAVVRKALTLALPQHYIYDILRQYWRGSLYTYAMNAVWDGTAPSRVYTTTVDAASFDAALATSLAEQLAEVTTKRRNVTAADRVFLKFLYSGVVSVADQSTHKFDVEHLIPVKRIQGMAAKTDPWPIGAVGNLAVLPAGPNRIKQDETVTEYLGRSTKAPSPAVVALVKKMILVKLPSVTIPQKVGKDAMTKAQYEKLVKSNWNAMCKQLKTNIGL